MQSHVPFGQQRMYVNNVMILKPKGIVVINIASKIPTPTPMHTHPERSKTEVKYKCRVHFICNYLAPDVLGPKAPWFAALILVVGGGDSFTSGELGERVEQCRISFSSLTLELDVCNSEESMACSTLYVKNHLIFCFRDFIFTNWVAGLLFINFTVGSY